jgi:hypothetical protein
VELREPSCGLLSSPTDGNNLRIQMTPSLDKPTKPEVTLLHHSSIAGMPVKIMPSFVTTHPHRVSVQNQLRCCATHAPLHWSVHAMTTAASGGCQSFSDQLDCLGGDHESGIVMKETFGGERFINSDIDYPFELGWYLNQKSQIF